MIRMAVNGISTIASSHREHSRRKDQPIPRSTSWGVANRRKVASAEGKSGAARTEAEKMVQSQAEPGNQIQPEKRRRRSDGLISERRRLSRIFHRPRTVNAPGR